LTNDTYLTAEGAESAEKNKGKPYASSAVKNEIYQNTRRLKTATTSAKSAFADWN